MVLVPPTPFLCTKVTSSYTQEGEKKVGRYIVNHTLGKGTFSTVKHCHDEFGNEFAMKIFKKNVLVRKREFSNSPSGMKVVTGLDKVFSEITIHKSLNSEYITAIYDILEDDEKNKLYVVMELMGGGPITKWNSSTFNANPLLQPVDNKIPESALKVVARSILSALNTLHCQGIVHRDVKPENILMDILDEGAEPGFVVKLADFTVAAHTQGEHHEAPGTQGTYSFLAPECCSSPEEDDCEDGEHFVDSRKVDIWAFGLSLWCSITGVMHVDVTGSRGLQGLFEDIAHCDPANDERFVQAVLECSYSKLFISFMTDLLTRDPICRPTAEEALKHEWLNSY